MIFHYPRQKGRCAGSDVRDPERTKLSGPDRREKLLHDRKPPSRAGSAAARGVDVSEKKPTLRNTLGHSTTSAYPLTGLPDQPGCPSSGLPTIWNQALDGWRESPLRDHLRSHCPAR